MNDKERSHTLTDSICGRRTRGSDAESTKHSAVDFLDRRDSLPQPDIARDFLFVVIGRNEFLILRKRATHFRQAGSIDLIAARLFLN